MRIRTTRESLLNTILELTGIKSGLGLSKQKFLELLNSYYDQNHIADRWWTGNPLSSFSIRAEEVESDFLIVMHSIGAIKDLRSPLEIVFDYVLKTEYRNQNPVLQNDIMEFNSKVSQMVRMILEETDPPNNLMDLAREARKRDIMNRNYPESRRWDGIISLSDLFESEEIPFATEPDSHFDQRFIEYLLKQESDLNNIHWRQFEFLCGEYFQRKNYNIEITPPRNDGGIDVKATKKNGAIGPELVCIQAKRFSGNNTVKINDVKAFWTDLNDLNATKGLIATTTKLETGARNFCEARKYRIAIAEFETVKNWLQSMSNIL